MVEDLKRFNEIADREIFNSNIIIGKRRGKNI